VYKKLRVGVLMGGKSIEKEVSFNSGRTICDHLDTSRYDIIPLFQTQNGLLYVMPWHFLHRGKITDFVDRLVKEAECINWDKLKKIIDFMYIATHGRYAEDGTLQGLLTILGIPYLGSDVFTSALCMDKVMQKSLLQSNDIATPRSITLYPNEIKNLTATTLTKKLQHAQLTSPYIVKPSKEGSSLGITVVFGEQDLIAAIKAACSIEQTKHQSVLVEEKINGMEFSCIILYDYKTDTMLPLPPTEIVPEKNKFFFDYEQKYMPGRAHKFTPPRCKKELIKKIQDTCIRVMIFLNIKTIARIDGFLTPDEQIIIVDPNTLSGMGPASFLFREAAEIGMGHTQLINHLIETDLKRYGLLENILQQEKKETKIMKKKMRIAVLLGGDSAEKEISLESGRNIIYKLSPQQYDPLPIFVTQKMELYLLTQSQLIRNSTQEIEALIKPEQQLQWQDLTTKTDFVFIALHGGNGENGTVQGALEMLGLPYNGSSVLTSALCMDKYKTNQFLQANNFAVPRNFLVTKHDWETTSKKIINSIQTLLSFPLICKPSDDGCSMLVQKIETIDALSDAINRILAHKNQVLIEELIQGMELTVGVFGNDAPHALPPSQAISQHGILSIEEKFLPGAGENQTPAPLSKRVLTFVQQTIEHVYKTIGCKGYARIDCFYQNKHESPTGKERIVILEINTLPGMTPATCIFHQAAEIGLKPMDFIDTIIQLGLQEHQILFNEKEKEIQTI
jgi:D-alanine--D-alanine ligase